VLSTNVRDLLTTKGGNRQFKLGGGTYKKRKVPQRDAAVVGPLFGKEKNLTKNSEDGGQFEIASGFFGGRETEFKSAIIGKSATTKGSQWRCRERRSRKRGGGAAVSAPETGPGKTAREKTVTRKNFRSISGGVEGGRKAESLQGKGGTKGKTIGLPRV